jgi:hypothetical protein
MPLPSPKTVLLAFPLERRIGFVRRLAAQVLARRADVGNRRLAAQLRVQAEALKRKGLGDDVVRRETASLEAAVRREIWRTVLGAPRPLQRDSGA